MLDESTEEWVPKIGISYLGGQVVLGHDAIFEKIRTSELRSF
jgi:hypothetical protein